jgi:hypothetical protein
MSKEKRRKKAAGCPVGSFFNDLDDFFGADADIGGHLQRSRLELLKAIRSWADGQIAHLEQPASARRGKKVTKIEVD